MEERGRRLSDMVLVLEEWWPKGVWVPVIDCRLVGRLVLVAAAAAFERLLNEVLEVMLARELGRLAMVLAPRWGEDWGMPKERRLCGRCGGCSGGCWMAEEASLSPVRFRLLRMVIVGGMNDWLTAETLRGEARGGVVVGAGSLDLAELTRCSSFCIFPIRPRIWWSEPDAVRPGPCC
jgi:hypothetical protein